MQYSKEEERKFTRRLLESRLRVLLKHGFYGILLMHLKFSLDEKVHNVAVEKDRISFQPMFLDGLSNHELDLVLIHEVMHLSLKHYFRKRDFKDDEVFDTAADIIVNSHILQAYNDDESQLCLLGEILPHKTPGGKEGREFSTEELYSYLLNSRKDSSLESGDGSSESDSDSRNDNKEEYGQSKERKDGGFDDHSRWNSMESSEMDENEWMQYNLDACETIYIRDPSNSRGTIPGYAAREFKELREPKTDWHTLLNNFIQENVNDYSFSPPDRRFQDSPFFLPDFFDVTEVVRNVLFMIDTSGSMSDSAITEAYSEVKGAIDQFAGHLKGWLGFFDAAIVEPVPFENEEEFRIIRPYGGGGTNFGVIFSYIRDKMADKEISSIVILTDGYAPFPKEEAAMDIPVIWLINNEQVSPPWGKVARILSDNTKHEYN